MTTGERARVPGTTDPVRVAGLREDEVRDEARRLGCEASFLRSRYYASGVFEEADVEALLAELLRLRPAWLLAPALEDPHPTHRLTRQVLDEAVLRLVDRTGLAVEVWSFEGPWRQHVASEANALVVFTPEAEARKLAAVRAHQSQLARVPFDDGAVALARLRGVTWSEAHFGGTVPGGMTGLPLVEAYVRELVAPAPA